MPTAPTERRGAWSRVWMRLWAAAEPCEKRYCGLRVQQMFWRSGCLQCSTNKNCCVLCRLLCAWALSFQTTLIYAWRRSTNKKKEMPKEEAEWRRRSLNGGVLYACVCACVVYFRFCIAIFLAERFACSLPLQRIFTLNTNIERLHYFPSGRFFSVLCHVWLHHGETVQ